VGRGERLQIANGIYHVTDRGNRGQRIFLDPRDAERFLGQLGEVIGRFSWLRLAYCLMPNHYHLLLATPEPNISTGMHRLKSLYARWFNARHDLTGHLFQSRFDARVVESDEYLARAIEYIHENPVRAGLCEKADDWCWSSARDSLTPPPSPPARAPRRTVLA
jgi:putative transposase